MTTIEGHKLQNLPLTMTEPPPDALVAGSQDLVLTASRVIMRLAEHESVDLAVLLADYDSRLAFAGASSARPHSGMRLLDRPDAGSSQFKTPVMAASFLEKFVLYPGLLIRGWNDPAGRMAFTLDKDDVAFELNVPDADLLIRGTPRTIAVAVGAMLPGSVYTALIGEPLERLVAWPPAAGPDHLVASISERGGFQVVTLATDPVKVVVGAGR